MLFLLFGREGLKFLAQMIARSRKCECGIISLFRFGLAALFTFCNKEHRG